MRLKLDENLGRRGAARLRAAGHDVATVLDQGLSSTADDDLIEICGHERRCLVTLDLDFSNPFRFPPDRHTGVAVLRLPSKASLQDLEDAVESLIEALAEISVEGQLWVVQRGRVRVYSPDS